MTDPHGRKPPKLGGSFLAGAQGRLLPASVPLRFFGAAVTFHALAWLALLAGAANWAQWHGGLGWPLAALHLVTLGTLLSSAIGASLQLLPVATRQPVRSPRAAAALWWVYVPGVVALALGMGLPHTTLLALGTAAVVAALATWAALLALNLRGARGMPGVVLHGWGALAALTLLAASALALVALWLGHPLLGRDTARALHLVAGVFGTMGLLALGLSYVLLPMFALAGVPDERLQLGSGGLALAAIALATIAAFDVAPLALRAGALAAGSVALALHLKLMHHALTTGMRRDLGRSLQLIRLSWGALALALAVALLQLAAPTLGLDAGRLGRLFVVLAVGGWLLSFLFGVLQRILPFLASMHAARGQTRPPTPSALTCERPLAWHYAAHLAALALLAAAVLADSAWLAGAAALAGGVGALAFGLFCVGVWQRLRRSLQASAATGARG